MKIKFRDSKNKLRILVVDDVTVAPGLLTGQEISRNDFIKQQIKEGKKTAKQNYGNLAKEHISEFANSLSENELIEALPELKNKASKFTKEDAVYNDAKLLEKFYNFLERNYVTEDNISYYFFLEWDPESIFRRDNHSNNQFSPSSKTKYINIGKIKDLTKPNNVEIVEHTKDDGLDVLQLKGTKGALDTFCGKVAELLTDAERGGDSKKFTNYKTSELEGIIERERERYLPQIEASKNNLEYFTYILEHQDEILNDPNASEEDLDTANLTKAELLSMIEEEKNFIEKTEKILEGTEKAVQGNVYDAEYVKKNYDYTGKGYIRVCDYSPQIFLEDSKSWFGIKGAKFNFKFEDSTLTYKGKIYNYLDVMNSLKKAYKDSKEEISFEKWISGNPKAVKNIINSLKDFERKGDKTEMKDSVKNKKFKFSDGIVIEVLESDGKNLRAVKDEAIKVYKQFKQMKAKDSADAGEYLGTDGEYKVYKITNYEQAHNYALPEKDGRGLAITGSELWLHGNPENGPKYFSTQVGRALDRAFYFYITSPLKDSWCVFFNKRNGGEPIFVKFEDDKETSTNPCLDLSLLPTPEGVRDSAKETEEVLKKHGAKASNDSMIGLSLVVMRESVEKALKEGKTVKEWYAESGKDYFRYGTPVERKADAIEFWNQVKDELESKDQNAEHEADEAEWDEAFKKADFHDSVEENTDAKYEVIVGGKLIGIFDTEEEAIKAEQKALDAVEKGIPNPTEE